MTATPDPGGGRRRWAVVGAGVRGLEMYAGPILGRYASVAELVALVDPNPLRLAGALRLLGREVPTYESVERMLAAARPDVVVVASRDDTHAAVACAALDAGAEVVLEKPMAIDAAGVAAIVEAERRSGRPVRLTFNYRYAPYASRVRELLAAGVVGDVLAVDFAWYLDRDHGADYFRRWHRRRDRSGSLLVHKATHHFDLLNWWLDAVPERVVADADRRFYGPVRERRGPYCRACEVRADCEFAIDLTADDELRTLYAEAEAADGYRRDGCVFDPEIDIPDTMGALVRYAGGPLLTYSLAAHVAYEGFRAAFDGRTGRLELEVLESGPGSDRASDPIVVIRPDGRVEREEIARGGEDHGGGDRALLDDLFGGPRPDPLGRAAGSLAGARSVGVGLAALRSLETGGWVRPADLLPGLDLGA
jgi:predicted dehydrogenase